MCNILTKTEKINIILQCARGEMHALISEKLNNDNPARVKINGNTIKYIYSRFLETGAILSQKEMRDYCHI